MKIRDFVNRSFLSRKSVLARRSKDADLVHFLELIKPVTTNHKLVRVGGEGDGGYLVPDDLAGIDTLFSPGVSLTADFELQLATQGVHCFMADYSVDATPINHSLFHFEKKFLGLTNDDVFTTLESWVQRNATSFNDMILQMDIEGAEYRVLLDTDSATLRRFRIIVIEFHELQELWQQWGLELIQLTFHKLLKDFAIVHIHPNNKAGVISRAGIEIPPLMEFTFLRRDRITSSQPTTQFPHGMDRANMNTKPDFPLPRCWHQSP